MSTADPKVEAFFARAKNWPQELAALRAILGDSQLVEEFKWRSPCYTFEGANVATIWDFKDGCGVGFFKGALLEDPQGILIALGENSRAMRAVKFTRVEDVEASATVLHRYIGEAIDLEKVGRKVEFRKDDLALPEELTDRLGRDPDLKAAFEALTPGRRRGYVLHIAQAKQPATRTARIDKCAPRIFEGKGLNDR